MSALTDRARYATRRVRFRGRHVLAVREFSGDDLRLRREETTPTDPVHTFILLHGSLLGPWSWRPVGSLLRAAGHSVIAPQLPFSDPAAGIETHLGVVAASLPAHTRATRAIVVAHSLAGLLAPGIASLLPGARVIFLAALLPSVGRSLVDQWEDEQMFDPAWARWGAPPAWEDEARAREFLFHDLSSREAHAAFAALTPDRSPLIVERAPTQWPSIDAAYIRPALDRTIRPDWMLTP